MCHGRSRPAVLPRRCPVGLPPQALAGQKKAAPQAALPRPWGLTFRSAPLGQVHLSGTSVSALAFQPFLRGLCRQKGAVHLLRARVGPLGHSRGMLAELIVRRVDSLFGLERGSTRSPTQVPCLEQDLHLPLSQLFLIIPHLSSKVKRKTALNMQIGYKTRNKQDLQFQNSSSG